jgi:hypothetical protein
MYSRSGGMVKGVPNAYEMNYHLAVAAEHVDRSTTDARTACRKH